MALSELLHVASDDDPDDVMHALLSDDSDVDLTDYLLCPDFMYCMDEHDHRMVLEHIMLYAQAVNQDGQLVKVLYINYDLYCFWEQT